MRRPYSYYDKSLFVDEILASFHRETHKALRRTSKKPLLPMGGDERLKEMMTD